MNIAGQTNNFSVFKDGRRLIGLADITLPVLKNMTDTLKGSGIFGEIEMPIQSQFDSMSVTLKWISITDDALFASIQDGATLDCWVDQQEHDSSTNKIVHVGWRYVFRTVPKSFNFGKVEIGTKGEPESEYELISLRVLHNDQVRLEMDKENGVFRAWDGTQLVDSGQAIRQNIGL